jgi:hypothetical protein
MSLLAILGARRVRFIDEMVFQVRMYKDRLLAACGKDPPKGKDHDWT